MDLTDIGKCIREKRISKKWKQEDLAEHTNLSVQYIGMIERGEKLPRLETFIRIANVLEASAGANPISPPCHPVHAYDRHTGTEPYQWEQSPLSELLPSAPLLL